MATDPAKTRKEATRRNIMVTGCAGFIGRALSRHFTTSGEQIVGLYREKLPEALERMVPLCSDMRQTDGLYSPLRNVDTVIHLAWEGGVLGSSSLRAGNPGQERLLLGANVTMTRNLVRSMERQGVKKIIFMSWMGAHPEAERLIQREKYWAEHVILNSSIPTKIIVRSGIIVDPTDKLAPFGIASQRMSKMPLIVPLPGITDNILLTSMSDLILKLHSIMSTETKPGSVIMEFSSTEPQSTSKVVTSVMSSWWGQHKIPVGGVVGSKLFSLVDSDFGRLPRDTPRLIDFLALSNAAGQIVGTNLEKKTLSPGPSHGAKDQIDLFR